MLNDHQSALGRRRRDPVDSGLALGVRKRDLALRDLGLADPGDVLPADGKALLNRSNSSTALFLLADESSRHRFGFLTVSGSFFLNFVHFSFGSASHARR
jgi:hypothetical protein